MVLWEKEHRNYTKTKEKKQMQSPFLHNPKAFQQE